MFKLLNTLLDGSLGFYRAGFALGETLFDAFHPAEEWGIPAHTGRAETVPSGLDEEGNFF